MLVMVLDAVTQFPEEEKKKKQVKKEEDKPKEEPKREEIPTPRPKSTLLTKLFGKPNV